MAFDRLTLAVYFILGSQNVTNRDPLLILEQALEGGITSFQFREKGPGSKKGNAKLELAKQMQKLCKCYDVPFFVNDDVELAIELHADGIHVGQDDESIESIRKVVPKNMKIGLSVTNLTQAIEAEQLAVDYIGVGPIFSTATKNDAKQPIGLEGLKEIKKSVPNIPIVAIGGIKKENVRSIREAGADGVSVISAISSDDLPKRAAQAFVQVSRDV